MTARRDSLIGNQYTVKRFADLSVPEQLAIVMFLAVDGAAWERVNLSALPFDNVEAELKGVLPQFAELYGSTLFGTVTLGAEAMQKAVMSDPEISEDFSCWDEYHAAYLSGGAPKHPETDRWPVILSSDDSETIQDGWHRFHSYLRDGATEVPAVFFPSDHHLADRSKVA